MTDQTTNIEAFGNYLLNPRRKAYEEDLATETSTEGTPAENEEAEFLIIYDKKFEEPVERLKKWKTQRGLKTETISTEEIEDSNDEEKREWIRERIQERRRKPHSTLRYVLLFGEVDSIPMSQGKVSTDHYFYTHKKTSGSECLLPWVSGGRIPMKNVDDATYIVDQIICYESEPPDDPGYYKRMTLAGHFQDREDFRSHRACRDGRAERNYIETMENIWKHMKSRGIEPKRAYFSNTLKTKDYLYSDGAKMPDDVKEDIIAPEGDEEEGLEMAECRVTKLIIKLINEGQLIVGHRGHGNDDGWTSPPFMVKDLAFISCDWPCIFFSINCSTGAYNAFKKSFAEHALARNGATSLVAATYPTNAWRNDSLIKALFDAVWPEMLPNFPDSVRSYEVKNRRLGDVLNYAKAYLLVKHGANSETKVLFESYHVIGDPTLEIWKDEPSKVSLQAGIASGNLTITMSTCPRDAVLTIWSGDKFLASKKPVSTQASLALGDLQEDPPYSVCFSAPGYRFAEIPVESD